MVCITVTEFLWNDKRTTRPKTLTTRNDKTNSRKALNNRDDARPPCRLFVDNLPSSGIHHPAMGNGYSGESVRHPTPVERDVAAPVDRVLSKERTTNADERDDKATDRYITMK